MPREKSKVDEVDLDIDSKPDHKLRWVNWVKKWARDHDGMAYGCALANPLCSAEYRENYPPIPRLTKGGDPVEEASFKYKTKKGRERKLKQDTQDHVVRQALLLRNAPVIKRNKVLKEIDEARKAIPGMLSDIKQERIHKIEEELEEKIDYIEKQGKMTLDKRKRIAALREEAKEKIKEIKKVKARPNPIRRGDRKPLGTVLGTVRPLGQMPMEAPMPGPKGTAFGLKGKGMTSVSTAEDTNGLTHIYPLTHGQILKIASR
jgi:hypothetical protein